MFEAEAVWLERQLRERQPEELSPILNIGSSTRAFREIEQPWSDRCLFKPLRARDIPVIHLDTKDGDGIDLRADILSEADLPKIRALTPKAIFCCNILEHVLEPGKLARTCLDIVGPDGFVFVTVPHSYPYHRDPIDTLFRPTPEELAQLFLPAKMVEGGIIDSGKSYRDNVRQRPWIIFRHITRFPFPFIAYQGWKRSMRKLYWLFNNYQITCAVFQVPPLSAAAQMASPEAMP